MLIRTKWALWGISVWGINDFGGDYCGFFDEKRVFVEKAHQNSLMGLSKWLTREDSYLGHNHCHNCISNCKLF